MKFTLAKQVLLDGINKVAGVVSTRPSMPILSNVLLDASDGLFPIISRSDHLKSSGSLQGSTQSGAKVLRSVGDEYRCCVFHTFLSCQCKNTPL
jgi:hypothetical protein